MLEPKAIHSFTRNPSPSVAYEATYNRKLSPLLDKGKQSKKFASRNANRSKKPRVTFNMDLVQICGAESAKTPGPMLKSKYESVLQVVEEPAAEPTPVVNSDI